MTRVVEAPPAHTDPAAQSGVEDKLRSIIMTTRDLPAMPQVAAKVLELSSDPDTSAQKLQQVIADDQAMTARILKIANSAMYSCSRRVKTLTEAIVMLGFNSIRSLVVTSAARNLYNTHSSCTGLKERLLWEHSIGAAFACRILAERCAPKFTEEAFLAGLLHDIGKLVLNQKAPREFDEIVQVVYNQNRSFYRTEREILGFDHAQVGALLIGKWKLASVLEDVIFSHHDPAILQDENPLHAILDLGNNLCHKMGIGFVEDPDLDLVGSPANVRFGLQAEDFEKTAELVRTTLETEMEIFI